MPLPAHPVHLQAGELFETVLPHKKLWELWNITAVQVSLKCWSAWLAWSWNAVIPFDMKSVVNLPDELPWQMAATHSIHHFREARLPHTFYSLCFHLLFCLSERSRSKIQPNIQKYVMSSTKQLTKRSLRDAYYTVIMYFRISSFLI